MRIVLADPAAADGFFSKDAVASGDGPRLRPFSRVTRIIRRFERRTSAMPGVQPDCAADGGAIFTGSPLSVRHAHPARAAASGAHAC
jgi:hypothetical protein